MFLKSCVLLLVVGVLSTAHAIQVRDGVIVSEDPQVTPAVRPDPTVRRRTSLRWISRGRNRPRRS